MAVFFAFNLDPVIEDSRFTAEPFLQVLSAPLVKSNFDKHGAREIEGLLSDKLVQKRNDLWGFPVPRTDGYS